MENLIFPLQTHKEGIENVFLCLFYTMEKSKMFMLMPFAYDVVIKIAA